MKVGWRSASATACLGPWCACRGQIHYPLPRSSHLLRPDQRQSGEGSQTPGVCVRGFSGCLWLVACTWVRVINLIMDVPDSWSEYLWALALTPGAISTDVYYKTAPLREHVHKFLSSPEGKEMKKIWSEFYDYYQQHGWEASVDMILDDLAHQAEPYAYKVTSMLGAWHYWWFALLCAASTVHYHELELNIGEVRNEGCHIWNYWAKWWLLSIQQTDIHTGVSRSSLSLVLRFNRSKFRGIIRIAYSHRPLPCDRLEYRVWFNVADVGFG